MIFVRKISKSSVILFSIVSILFLSKIVKIPILNADNKDEIISKETEEIKEPLFSESTKLDDESDQYSDLSSDSSEVQHEICNFLSDDVKKIFNSIDNKKASGIFNDLDSIYKRLVEKYENSEHLQNLADLSVLSLFINSGLVDNEKFSASEIISRILDNYKNITKSKYDSGKYSVMEKDSLAFSETGKKTESCSPENVISLASDKILNNYPIKYDGKILVSLEDLFNISEIPYDIEYMDNNSTIVIKLRENKVLEIESGNNEAFLNDNRQVMNNPVLNVQGVVYVSVNLAKSLGCQIIECNDSVVIF